jgi:phosphomannomutase/phosphoglucomutase
MTALDPHIFRAYDIRGKAGSQITEEACELVARGFASAVRDLYGIDHPRIALGRDARTHGPAFEEAALRGLLAAGCEVLRIGQTPSPVSYFTICAGNLDGSMQITASHNPAEDNGIKLQLRDAEAFAGEDLQRLKERIERQEFVSGKGTQKSVDAVEPYLFHVTGLFAEAGRGLSVVIDAGNGVAGPAYSEGLRRIGCTVTELYTKPDGTFPNHAADPSKHDTLRELQEKVKEIGADIGVAFDGDGDRLGVVDEQGAIRSADDVILLLAQDHLSRNAGMPVVFTVSNSGALESEITKWGGKPVMCKVGHSFVEHAMRECGALLGGEQSGHFFCGESYYAYDDALVAALRVIKILRESGKPLSQLFAAFPPVYQIHEIRPSCPDDKKSAVIASVIAHFQKTHPVNTLDGARIDFGEESWAGIRQSNTSPRLSIVVEARSPKKLAEVENAVLSHLRSYPEVAFD